MKKSRYIISTLFVFLLFAYAMQAQNYSSTKHYRVSSVSTKKSTSSSGTNAIKVVTYLDGLGRSIQEIAVDAGNGNGDIVQHIEYDPLGRIAKQYLPFDKNANKGAFVGNAGAASLYGVYAGESAYAYAQAVYEDNPLGRIIKQGAPGAAWQINSHSSSIDYDYNTSTEVSMWSVNSSGNLVNEGNYPVGTLSKVTLTDEDGNKSEEFTDRSGRMVCKKAYNGAQILVTCMVYDDLGMLRYVLPPKAVEVYQNGGGTSYTLANEYNLIYAYQYDDLGRQIVKKLPGVQAVYMVYDKKNRLVLSQDGNQSATEWSYILYDNFNRPVETGECTLSGGHANLQTTVGTSENYIPAVKSAFTYTYYDDYSFTGASAFDTGRNISGEANYYNNVSGLITGTKVKVLDGTGNNWITSTNYYDDKCRLIQSTRNLYPSGTNVVSTKYNFAGNILQVKEYQSYSGNVKTLDKYYSYDHVGRLLKEEESHNGGASKQELVEMTYDELGRLKSKQFHNGIENINYTYNIRNWLTGMQGSKFKMNLFYNDVSGLSALDEKACYNGNIAGMRWQNTAYESVYRNYAYKYDGLNRLLKADYGEGASAVNKSAYDVSGLSYDKNGNILSLSRNMNGQSCDNLAYNYRGNQLNYVNDSANDNDVFKEQSNSTGAEYNYDGNGNMTSDANSGITSIAYNNLNLPETIVKNGKTIRYIYTASGEKLQNILPGKTLSYCGSFVYEGTSLKQILNEAGRYVINGSSSDYEYHIKDHLGNVRMVLNSSGANIQTNNYYPFGAVFSQYSGSDNKHL
ncbi:MAG: DUF6443 domain-containing protein, partial [Marinifilum sp.]|nr:DUF6443 domain-containing protein [Marinifilum sp.]